MSRALRLYMENGVLHMAFRLYVDVCRVAPDEAQRMVDAGVRRYEALSPYTVCGQDVPVRVHIEYAPRFGLDCVNVRVYDKTPVRRRMLDPRINVSRAYFGTRRRGTLKLMRFIMRKPDVYINYAGRDLQTQAGRTLVEAVVMHEFGHVLGLKDKYRRLSGKKRGAGVQDRDFMYRTGGGQRPMEYQMAYLLHVAERGRLSLRSI